MGLVISILCGFKLLGTIWSVINCLAITVSGPILVFRMLLFKLKPRFIDAWSWLNVSNNFRTNEISWYLEICIVKKYKLSRRSLSAQKLWNSEVYLGKSSAKNDLMSCVDLSNFWGDIAPRSMKHLRITFFW